MRRKIKVRKKYNKYSGGGNFDASTALNVTGDVAGMIPGFGPLIGGAIKMLGGGVKKGEQARVDAWGKTEDDFNRASKVDPQPSSPVLMALGGQMLKENDAPSHDAGGQTIDANGNPAGGDTAIAEIEKNETTKDGFAYSPNLIDALTGKTFADASADVEKKYKKQITNGDDIAKRTRDKELDSLKGANEEAKAQIQAEQNAAMEKKLAPFLQAMQAQQQAPQGQPEGMPQGALGGHLNKLNNGGTIDPTKNTDQEIIPNDNIYSGATFKDVYGQMGSNDKKLQEAIAKYGTSVGQNYLPKFGVDGKAGTETKAFFDDPMRVKGFNQMMNADNQSNQSLTFNSGNTPSIPNQKPTYTQSDQTNATKDPVNYEMYKYLDEEGVSEEGLATQLKNALNPGNTIDKSGNIVAPKENDGMADSDTSDEGDNKKGKNGKFKEWMQKLKDGDFDQMIGTGLKGVETLGSWVNALRGADQIDTEYNLNAKTAEHEMRKRGQQLTAARTANTRGLAAKLQGNQNAMSQSQKFAMDAAAQTANVNTEVDIAAKEKALNDNVGAQLSQMISRHGTEDKQSRNVQEVKQSQTDAKSAEAVQKALETTGNLGELYSKKAAIAKKADEQFAIINQKYPNMKLGTRKEFAKAVSKGDIGNFVKFVKTQNVTMDEAMKMAEELPTGKQKAAKAKIQKQYKKKK